MQKQIIWGWHAVAAALQNKKRKIVRVFASKCKENSLKSLTDLPIEDIKKILHKIPKQAVHQNVVVETYVLLQKNLEKFLKSPLAMRVCILDQVNDVHNVGAIVRSMYAFGIDALIIPHHKSANIFSPYLIKATAGAAEKIPFFEVKNLVQTIRKLQESNFFVAGVTEHTQNSITQLQASSRLAVVLGSEEKGIRRLVAKSCDALYKIDTQDCFSTLNVAQAASIVFYEAAKLVKK